MLNFPPVGKYGGGAMAGDGVDHIYLYLYKYADEELAV